MTIKQKKFRDDLRIVSTKQKFKDKVKTKD